MKYEGNLYGKVGRKYIPLIMNSADVHNLESENQRLVEVLKGVKKDLCNTFDDEDFKELGEIVMDINKSLKKGKEV